MKKLFIAYFVLLFCLPVCGQDIEVKKFEPMTKDQTAALSPRKDINGITCGLVKVALKEPGAEFEGSVMGDVQFTGNEYLVYLPNGTKRLGIKHPDYLPTTIVFADYGTHPEELLSYEYWIDAFCYVGNPEKALELYYPIKEKIESRGGWFMSESYMSIIGKAFLKKKRN